MLKRRINEYGQGIRGTSLSNGLVSWYGLNGTTEDSTSNTNPSVIGDITYTQDLGRKVGYFNGYSCIDTNTSNFGLSTGSNITLSCFVKFTDISLADQGLIHQYNGGGYGGTLTNDGSYEGSTITMASGGGGASKASGIGSVGASGGRGYQGIVILHYWSY